MERRGGEVVLPELLDVKQVAAYLGLHRVTVVEFARLGKLPAFKVGREWRFRADAIKQWLERQAREAPAGQAEDEFDRLWRRFGEQVDKAGVSPGDVPYVIAEVRGPSPRGAGEGPPVSPNASEGEQPSGERDEG
jgi:excisionase family DNA binding protein